MAIKVFAANTLIKMLTLISYIFFLTDNCGQLFTAYRQDPIDPNWNSTFGYFSEGLNATGHPYKWDIDVISYYGMQTDGINGLLLSFEYSIGYLSIADVHEWVVHTALVKNDVGEYLYPNYQTVAKAMDYFTAQTADLNFPITHALSYGSYPIAGFTHFIVYKTNMTDCLAAKEFVRYTYWALTDSAPRHECEILGFAPLNFDRSAW